MHCNSWNEFLYMKKKKRFYISSHNYCTYQYIVWGLQHDENKLCEKENVSYGCFRWESCSFCREILHPIPLRTSPMILDMRSICSLCLKETYHQTFTLFSKAWCWFKYLQRCHLGLLVSYHACTIWISTGENNWSNNKLFWSYKQQNDMSIYVCGNIWDIGTFETSHSSVEYVCWIDGTAQNLWTF